MPFSQEKYKKAIEHVRTAYEEAYQADAILRELKTRDAGEVRTSVGSYQTVRSVKDTLEQMVAALENTRCEECNVLFASHPDGVCDPATKEAWEAA